MNFIVEENTPNTILNDIYSIVEHNNYNEFNISTKKNIYRFNIIYKYTLKKLETITDYKTKFTENKIFIKSKDPNKQKIFTNESEIFKDKNIICWDNDNESLNNRKNIKILN